MSWTLITFGTLALACGKVALLAVRATRARSFDTHTRQAIALTTHPARCLGCPGAPMVADYRAHSDPVHRARAAGPDDDPEFLTSLGGAR